MRTSNDKAEINTEQLNCPYLFISHHGHNKGRSRSHKHRHGQDHSRSNKNMCSQSRSRLKINTCKFFLQKSTNLMKDSRSTKQKLGQKNSYTKSLLQRRQKYNKEHSGSHEYLHDQDR